MIPKDCKRLAEVDFPIAEVSKQAAREKSIRHGHPSTLHLWWARRPLASSRAGLLGLLWPDPCDPLCPEGFKQKACELLPQVQGKVGPTDEDLRKALLKFIGDFANWDLSTNRNYLEVSRALVKSAHGEEPPLVVDPFAGGGSIPLEALHGERTGEQILGDLCKWMDANGALATLRHGFKCYGRTLHVAFFKAAHELNPELETRYAANRVGLTRQLHFSPRSEHSLDVTLSLNGIPVVTLELKNPLTNQTVEDARRQYKQDRDARERIFEFKRRTLVHFAVDTESVLMTTRLAGTATHFLPFNKGRSWGARNRA